MTQSRSQNKETITALFFKFFLVFVLLSIFNIMFYNGNNPDKKEINQYIDHFEVLKLENNLIPTHKRVRYKAGFRLGSFYCFMRKEIYYLEKQNKYISILTFENFMDNKEREIYRVPWEIKRIYVNTNQYNNIIYGSKENPVPAFPLLYKANKADSLLNVPIKLNKIFVEQYLKHFMPKEEYKEMFKK